jgi:hypothetical protein
MKTPQRKISYVRLGDAAEQRERERSKMAERYDEVDLVCTHDDIEALAARLTSDGVEALVNVLHALVLLLVPRFAVCASKGRSS